jgi:hypothetical protein
MAATTHDPQSSPFDKLNNLAIRLQESFSNPKPSKVEHPLSLSSVGGTADTLTTTVDAASPLHQIGATFPSKANSAITSMDRASEATAAKKWSSLLAPPITAENAAASTAAASTTTTKTATFATVAASSSAESAVSMAASPHLMAAMVGKTSAAALAAQHGWSEDLFGVIQIIVATLLAVPRTIVIVEGVTDQPIDLLLNDLYQSLIAPLMLAPLQGVESMTPFGTSQGCLVERFAIVVGGSGSRASRSGRRFEWPKHFKPM